MYEVMTQAAPLYAGWKNAEVKKEVEMGYRLPLPEGCSEMLYAVVSSCWSAAPDERPSVHKMLEVGP